MWNGTRIMAENIASGIVEADPDVNVKIHNIARSDKNDVIADVFKSKAVFLGSPTINRGILTAMAGLLEEIKG
jgi:flavorubredoxin